MLAPAWKWVLGADRLVRIHFLSFSALWPLLGATTVRRSLTIADVTGLVAVTVCFHVYTMLFNDVVDLPIDRTQPKRQQDPLVRGAIKPWQVLVIAFVQPLLTVPLTIWMGGSGSAHATLGAGFVLMAAYNLWGKRCPFPPLTDAIQGAAWGTLAIYAALLFAPAPNAMTWLVAAYVVVFTLLFNGVHGPLRDLDNDFACHAMTTAILLGARPVRGGDPIVPRAVVVFAALTRAVLIGVVGAIVFRNDFGYGPARWTVTAIAVAAMIACLVVLHNKVVHPRRQEWDVAFRLDLFLLTMSLPAAFVAYAGRSVIVALVLLNAIALALFPSTPAVARWAWRAIVTIVRPVPGKPLAAGISGTD